MAFAQIDEDIMIDHIPLSEIDSVQMMETESEEFKNLSNSPTDLPQQHPADGCSFSIKCVQDGYNKGRLYYFCSETPQSAAALVKKLKQAALSAKFRAQAHTRFAKSQYFVRKIYTSNPFHYTSATLIIGVSAAAVPRWSIDRSLKCSPEIKD